MTKFLVRLVITAIAVWVAVRLVPGLEFDGSIATLLVIALVIGIINALLRPIVMVLSCPLLVLSMGLFVLVINTLMLWLTLWVSSTWELGLTSTGLLATFLGAIVISIVSGVLSMVLRDGK